ncbi:MAG TPA: pseudouridine synthase [Chitinophagaceae bacterium]|nr:pseudouridine synthase [Chitinophagaceae bacterium]
MKDITDPPHRYFAINKPYDMLSQFKSEREAALLGDLNFPFPPGTHAIGRLDKQSEGLLLLTTNKKITKLLFQGTIPHTRTYLVRVKNTMSKEALEAMRAGLHIRGKGGEHYLTAPCPVEVVEEPTDLFQTLQPFPLYPPYTWLTITLTQGKFRQIRKMTAALHHRCQRLIRTSIEDIHLGKLLPGEVRELEEEEFFSRLRIARRA